ncbi:hypothetical protein [Dactylosporangium sp. NPDC051541]|uniref:hypothetical protein n=1 Tax=Dactylosporangium sp. NPDC051541 TaxID=3363977 RepID=UPI00379CD7BF
MTAMLRYTVVPDEVPVSGPGPAPRAVALQLRVTNTGGHAVALDRLEFALDPGDSGDRLTGEQEVGGIVAAATGGTEWYARGDGAGTFSAVPWRRGFRLEPGGSIAFDLADIVVNREPGTAHLVLGDGTALAIRKIPAPPRIVKFESVPAEVELGRPSMLEWATTGAGACTLTTPDGTEDVGLDGFAEVWPADTYAYTLVAEGDGPAAKQRCTVTVAGIAIAGFSATPRRVAKGDEVMLRWDVHNAASVTIDPGRLEVDPRSGARPVRVEADTRFRLTAGRGSQTPVVAYDSVEVMPVELDGLAATPPVVRPGESSTLHWEADWTSGFRLAWPGGSVELPRGATAHAVHPAATTTYTLTARGRDERTDDVTVTAGPAITRLTLVTEPDRPGRVRLRWKVQGGRAELGVGGTSAPPMEPVADEDDRWITRLPRVTHIRVASGERSAVLALSGFGQDNGVRVERLDLTAAAGFTSPGAKAAVEWVTHGGTTYGDVADHSSTRPIRGAAGRVPVHVGPRAAFRPLWTGDLTVEHRGGAYAAVDWQTT